jgi:ubiquinone/menaquinone biosynthesis C-methylase UbiE
MKRETINKIRFVLEEILPPIVHDSRFMVFLYKLKWGSFIEDLAQFRKKAAFLTDEEYRDIYQRMPRLQESTDNSEECVELICENIIPGKVCDIGCGTGHLLNVIQRNRPDVIELTGVDFVLEEGSTDASGITFVEAPVESLPFADNAFDTVICTHVLEHILDIGQAVTELRRIAARRLIIVVPIEREHVYTFNPHFHFFPFTHSFLRVMRPHPDQYKIQRVQRDIFYIEDQAFQAKDTITEPKV